MWEIKPWIMEAVRASAVQLASQHLDIVSSVKEFCEAAPRGGRASDTAQLLVPPDGPCGHLHASSATEGVWYAVMGCWVEGDECHLLSSQQRCKLAAVLQTASSLVDSLLFCPHLFLQLVVEQQLPQVPLEVVWSVHAASLLSLEAILHDNPASVQYIVSALVDVSCKDGRDEGQKAVMQGVVQVLCGLILSKSAVALEVLQQLPAAFLAQPSPVHYSLVRAAVECPFITSSTTTELGSILLSACFAHPSSSLLEVIPLQTQWQYSTLPNSTVSLYSDLVLSLGSTHFVQLLQKALSVEQLNWPAILQAVACFLHSDSALDIFAGLVRNLVRRGLEDGDTHQLSCGLVLARQASLEGTHHFPPYHSWFQTMFGGGPDGVIGGKKQLLFLLKTLTGLVPHDPVFVLKAHITHPPRQLPRCLSQLKDYISLASTRLQDLGEKVPSAGSEDLEYDAASDVAEAIAYYREHGRISQPVMEASIFRLPYFMGRFLQSLLSPSLIAHESRESLISALVREKKIPQRMLRNYEKACLELRKEGSSGLAVPLHAPRGVACVLRDLPCEAEAMTNLLSRLSATLHCDTSLHPPQPLVPSAVQLVDDTLNAVCETIILQEGKTNTNYRWLGDFLTVLSRHTALHLPLYLRLSELLTRQIPDLTSSQLLGLAVLLSKTLCLSPCMATVMDGHNSLSTGEEYCVSLLSGLRHDTATCMAQSMRFGCLFMEHCMGCCSSGHPVPHCLLHKMVYMYRRSRFLQTHTCTAAPHPIPLLEVSQAVEGLLEYHLLADQWHSCKVRFSEWLSWELDVNPTQDGMNKHCRLSYRWNVIVGDYLQTSSTEELFTTLFKALAGRSTNLWCAEFLAILQELSLILPAHEQSQPSSLLSVLQGILCTTCSGSLAADSMILASSLPPRLLFSNRQMCSVQLVADFIQHTLAPAIQHMMVLPAHIMLYLTLGASTVAGDTHSQLCHMSSTFLASSMAHWPLLSGAAPCSYSTELSALASWIHSGPQGPLPLCASSLQLALLGVALWHRLTADSCSISQQLLHVPAQVVVLVNACSVHWLALHPHPHPLHSTVKDILNACLQREPSSVEVFCNTQLPSRVQLQHSELLASFRSIFSFKPSEFYPVVLLRLLGGLSVPVLCMLLAEPCFLWLSVSAHAHCLSLCSPLPSLPPLSYQPLSVEFIQDGSAALRSLIQLADCSQLQNVLGQCHSQLQSLVKSKLRTDSTL